MGTEQYTVGVVTRGRTESTIRFITYYANNVALWEAGKEAKLVSKICAEDIVKDLCMSGTLAVPILVKDYLQFKKPRCSRRRSKNIKLTKPVLLKIIFKKGEKE